MVLICGDVERKRQLTPASSDFEKKDEEEWQMKDVVFVDDVKTVPIGKVVKVRPCEIWPVGFISVI